MARSFTDQTFEKNKVVVGRLIAKFGSVTKLAAENREGMKELQKKMREQDLALFKKEPLLRSTVRAGKPTLNKTSLRAFCKNSVLRSKNAVHIDQVAARALDAGYVCLNKGGLSQTVGATLAGLASMGEIEAHGNGIYSKPLAKNPAILITLLDSQRIRAFKRVF